MKLSSGVEILEIPSLATLTEEQVDRLREWTLALRSRKFVQGNSCLRNGIEFCCLGVFVEINKKEWGGHWRAGTDKNDVFVIKGQAWEGGVLPELYRSKSGLPSVGGFHVKAKTTDGIVVENTSLVVLNDIGTTFMEIADIIEIAITGGYCP